MARGVSLLVNITAEGGWKRATGRRLNPGAYIMARGASLLVNITAEGAGGARPGGVSTLAQAPLASGLGPRASARGPEAGQGSYAELEATDQYHRLVAIDGSARCEATQRIGIACTERKKLLIEEQDLPHTGVGSL